MGASIQLEKSFTDSSAGLSKELKARIQDLYMRLQNNPQSSGLHKEPIQSAGEHIYSLRLNDNYRIICYSPENNFYAFLYAGKHDAAYRWAQTHCCRINETTGGLQVYEPTPKKTVTVDGKRKQVSRFAKVTDEQFDALDIPEEYRDILRTKVFSKGQLLGFRDSLSDESYCALEWISQSCDIKDVIALYEESTAEIVLPNLPSKNDSSPAFEHVTDEQLAHLGVPQEYIGLVRLIKSDTDISRLQEKLPEDAVQSLYALYAGEPFNSIFKNTFADSHAVDDDDYTSALKNPITKAGFVEVTSAEELRELLEMPTEKWRVFLHPSQRRLVERNYNGPARVLGGAGTGKTIVIVHRAKYLAQQCRDNEKVLVTTFTSLLTISISKLLRMICSDEEYARIEVTNIDSIIRRILAYRGFRIAYNDGYLSVNWKKAMINAGKDDAHDYELFRQEWEYVIQAQNLKTLDQYLSASRQSRGKRLDRKSRESVWAVCEEYKRILEKSKICDKEAAQNICTEICTSNPSLHTYKSILIDECQDISAPGYRMLRALAGEQHENDLFFAGDSRQRIYKSVASFSQCGISVTGKSSHLKLNYRTTYEINAAADRLQQDFIYDDMDENYSNPDNTVSILHGEKPSIFGYLNANEEIQAVIQDIEKRESQGIPLEEMCIAVRTNRDMIRWAGRLIKENIPVLQVGYGYKATDDSDSPGVRIMTMHRAKGMEFTCMYIVSANRDIIPNADVVKHAGDKEELHELLKTEANLLSVAITRAKRFVWISYYGQPSELLAPLMQ